MGQGIALGSNLAPPRGYKFYIGLQREKLPSLPVSCHKAWAYQILHVALSSEPYQECPMYSPGGHKFYLGLYRENFRNLPVPGHKA